MSSDIKLHIALILTGQGVDEIGGVEDLSEYFAFELEPGVNDSWWTSMLLDFNEVFLTAPMC